MSLESYKKALENQRIRQRKFNPEETPKQDEPRGHVETEYVLVEPRSGSRRTGALVTLILLVAILMVAAIKNPSESESRKLVNNYIVEKINDKLRDEMTNDENDGLKQLGAFIGMTFSSHILEYLSETEVNDCVLFSTFNCKAKLEDTSITIAKGIILFGKVIPLKTDLNLK